MSLLEIQTVVIECRDQTAHLIYNNVFVTATNLDKIYTPLYKGLSEDLFAFLYFTFSHLLFLLVLDINRDYREGEVV